MELTYYCFDFFNSKNYNISPSNFFDITANHRDLLSLLCIKHAVRNSTGGWLKDPFKYALDNKLINPHDLLPKKEGHKLIAKDFIKKLS